MSAGANFIACMGHTPSQGSLEKATDARARVSFKTA
jgi:hypothetical protein